VLSGYREVELFSNFKANLNGKPIVFGSDTEIHLCSPVIQDRSSEVDQTLKIPFSVGIALEEVPNARQWLRAKAFVEGGNAASDARSSNNDLPPSRWVFGTSQHASADNSFLSSNTIDSSPTALTQSSFDRSDDWEVKDFGFGFGPMNGTSRGSALVREEILARVAERDPGSPWGRGPMQTAEPPPEGDFRFEGNGGGRFLRGRRGGLSGYRDRGGYRGRSGQGFRRGFGSSSPYQGHPAVQSQLIPGPSNHYHSLKHPDLTSSNYYAQPPIYSPYGVGYDVQYATYPPLPLVQPLAPGPGPVSVLSFPLDYTRYYLLGQLEYYLSPQNMAQDYYLRQQMNPEGWIPVSLLASFNRVQQFTTDIEMVQEVLTYSLVVEVSGDWVRMSGEQWRPYILPVASHDYAVDETANGVDEVENHPAETEEEGLVDEDEEEEEVEFVMG